VTGGDRAIPLRKTLLPGVRGKRGWPEAGTKKRYDKPQGQSSRRAAVVCDAPEAMGSKPGFEASEQSEVAR